FGDYLPFNLNHLLFYLPGYNKFRGPYRNQVTFTLALAVLAGWGLQTWIWVERACAKKLLKRANLLLAVPIIITTLAYCRFHHLFLFPNPSLDGIAMPKPQQSFSLFDPSAQYPLFFFLLSSLLLWIWSFYGKATEATASSSLAS